jgi:uncharacterized protein YkwD
MKLRRSPKKTLLLIALAAVVSLGLSSILGVLVVYRDLPLAAVLPAALDDMANTTRLDMRLGGLKTNPLIVEAAQMKANDMARRGYFAHTSKDGKTPWYWLDEVGYKYDYAGENLAVNFGESKDVHDAWMNSPSHRANLLKSNYTEIGTAVATGTYKGGPAVFVVEFYGRPLEEKK